MDHDDWMRFLRRMDDTGETFILLAQTYRVLTYFIYFSSLLPVFAPLLIGWCDNETKIHGKCSEEPPPWRMMLFGILLYSWYFYVDVPFAFIVSKILKAPEIIWIKSQKKIGKEMQLAFKCSG